MKAQKTTKLWLIGIGVCIILAGLWYWLEPYSGVIRALHSGMAYNDVQHALGSGDWEGDDPLVYKKSGVNDILLIYFNNPGGTISAWFIVNGPIQNGYSEYKVEKSHGYDPGGRMEGPTGIVSIGVTIITTDISGKPVFGR